MGDAYLVVSGTQAIVCAVVWATVVIGLLAAPALIRRARKRNRNG